MKHYLKDGEIIISLFTCITIFIVGIGIAIKMIASDIKRNNATTTNTVEQVNIK